MMTEQVKVTQADRDAVTAFHNVQAKRILAGDRTLGDNRDMIEQAFARHRIAAQAELLEALEEVFADHSATERLSWIDKAAGAIAKAKGEA